MKRRDLERIISGYGWRRLREGGSHSIWGNGKGVQEPIPRHKEINEHLARKIIEKAKNNPG